MLDGKYHRLFGPAIALKHDFCFYKNGLAHRLNAPAHRRFTDIVYYEYNKEIKSLTAKI